MTRYDLLYLFGSPVIAPYLIWRRVTRGKYTESAGGMLGRRLPQGEAAAPFRAGSIWLHAVSVGEVAAARAVAPGLRALAPNLPLVVSTITETGQAAARRAFPNDAVTYFPADYSPNVRRFLATFNPRVFVLMETEIWPNFLTMAAARGAQCFMINAKVSDRSFPRYLRARRFMAPAFAALRGVCAQTEIDAHRFAALGVPPERIAVAGNCKFDLEAEKLSADEKTAMLRDFGMAPSRRWIVAGSTHPGEEDQILDAFKTLAAKHPDAGLVMCARHPDRFSETWRLIQGSGLRAAPASQPNAQTDPQIVLLDKMGVLAKSYGLGEIAIVAGSFCEVGGHNLLEAAAHGVPVVYGPRMHSQREIQRIFKQANAGIQIEAAELAPALARLFDDAAWREESGRRSLAALELNRGSAARAVGAVRQWMDQGKL